MGAAMLNEIDADEVYRDLINWMDGTQPFWRNLPACDKAELLDRAHRYLAAVSCRYRIPDSDFMPPLYKAATRVRMVHSLRELRNHPCHRRNMRSRSCIGPWWASRFLEFRPSVNADNGSFASSSAATTPWPGPTRI
jgi:hypothetical protein